MKNPPTHRVLPRRLTSCALIFAGLGLLGFAATESFSAPGKKASPVQAKSPAAAYTEPASLSAFRKTAGGQVKPYIVELKGEPGVLRKVAAEKAGQGMSQEQTVSYAMELVEKQDALLNSLGQRGVRALLRKTDVKQINGAMRHIEYRFTYLLNGFVAYLPPEDAARLRAFPEVANVSEPQEVKFHLDRAIDYSLGTKPNPADRRTDVYGATKEFRPLDDGSAHPETPRPKIDGYEGQEINIAVIDSGIDYRHPMFGGTGLTTPLPRISGNAANEALDNKKVVYFYTFNEPVGDPTDDFGHGTLVSSCAAGFSVDGNTPANLGYGIGRDGTGIGPTTNGSMLFGTAPQSRLMAYKVCGPAPQCAGDIELSIEDAASPFTLITSGNPSTVAKPVADVINLSLGDTSGDPAGTTSRAANNAALAGTIVVASAGNEGPGPGTIGAPAAATLVLSVAAGLDPGSIGAGNILAQNQVPLDPCGGAVRPPTCDTGTQPAGPAPEEGATSNANAPQPGTPQDIKIFPVAGGGALPVESNPGDPASNTGSVSAHYVYVDQEGSPGAPPVSVTNRIAVVRGTGAFANIANSIAPLNPAAILIVTDVDSATALVVVGGIPTYTVSEANAATLLDLLIDGTANGSADPPNGAVSLLPIRLAESFALANFQGGMATFSSRGPNDQPNARYRVIKPDVTGPGVGIFGAATPDGLPSATVGLADPSGYVTANGTSFSGPITAGAMALVRQRVREELGLDSTDLMASNYRAKRFDTVLVARALLQNSATNLRSGLGQPQGNGASSVASINDMGSGFINVAGALHAQAIMVAPTDLLTDPEEYTADPAPTTPLQVMIPTVSFGEVPVVNVNGIVSRMREVVIRDVGVSGAGSGNYNLAVEDNRLPGSGFAISFRAADGVTPITSVNVPGGGQTSFFVRVEADGTQLTIDPTEIQWYVSATRGTDAPLRMPFYFRAIAATIPNIAAPTQLNPQGTEQPPVDGCAVDTTGDYTLQYSYAAPGGGATPVGFRIQEGTRSDEVFFDNADEPLVAGANSLWSGSQQWNSNVNPQTASPAYFIPDAAMQDESLTMINAVTLPPGGATLSFVTNQDTEQDFDFAHVEISADGVNFTTVASFSGAFVGTRFVDISGYAGQSVRIRFRMASDLVGPAGGWYVEDIRISSDDFTTIGETAPGSTSFGIPGRPSGTYTYRIAALFDNPGTPGTTITGPYSNLMCVTVQTIFDGVVSRKTHGAAGVFDIDLGGPNGIECRSGGTNGEHQVIFTFANTLASVGSAQVSGESGNPMINPVGTGPGPGANQYTVNLTGVNNLQTVTVTLANIQDTSSTTLASAIGTMDLVLGDISGNRAVNAADIGIAKSQSGQSASAMNFRTDVTVNGVINAADVGITKAQSGTTLPPAGNQNAR